MTLEQEHVEPPPPLADFEIVGRDTFNLTFRSHEIYAVKSSVWLRAQPAHGGDPLELELLVRSAFVLADERIEYTGKLNNAPPGFANWEGTIVLRDQASRDGLAPAAAEPPAEQRRGRRLPRTFQVTSRHLSRYKALSSDISATGLRLMAEEPLAVGKVLDLTLDFDDFRYPHMAAHGEVVWCRPRDSRTWWAGLKFVNMSEDDMAVIEEYISFCIRRKTTGNLEPPRSSAGNPS